jgi:hypothetical protein
MPDPIKDAFSKVKSDIEELKSYIFYINEQLEELRQSVLNVKTSSELPSNSQTISPADTSVNQSPNSPLKQTNNLTENSQISAFQQENPTNQESSAVFPADKMPLKGLKTDFLSTSIGNRGVPTDQQTVNPTDRQQSKTPNSAFIDRLSSVSEIVNSLDSLKKEVRTKFKRLTKQEMQVFSSIFQLEEQGFVVDYPLLAHHLNLSESSIRDYTQRLIKKGIPLLKAKENNKKITLSVSPDLKRVASLATILQLREL